jgi:GAF domain-containing protein
MSPTPPPLSTAAVAPSLEAVVALAHQVVPSAVAVSLTVVSESGAETVASTSAWAESLDRVQYEAGAGPCVDAAIGGEPRSITDIRRDTRWPAYAAVALADGALSSLSLPIPVDNRVVASLNAYATHVDAFSSADQARLQKLAGVAAAVLTTAEEPQLRSRAGIDQAKGVLMHEEHCSAGRALDILAARALAGRSTLREVSADVLRVAAG